MFGWLIMFSVGIGIALSIWLLNRLIQKLIDGKPVNLFGLSSSAPTGSKIGSYFIAILSIPFAFFFGFSAGGILGGGTGEALTHSIGLGDLGVAIGIGLGVFIVMTIIMAFAAVVGFILGGVIERLVKKLGPGIHTG